MNNYDDFFNQSALGQWPTLMLNVQEKKVKQVDTLAITMIIVYLAQLRGDIPFSIEGALDFIESKCYIHENEGFRVWHFNAFYPPDWEDTAMAVFVLLKNNRIRLKDLEPLRSLLIQNTSEIGAGVWIKDPYSVKNSVNNHWDPTTALNVLRLYCLLDVDKSLRFRLEKFVINSLVIENFYKMTLYYTPALAAFFAKQLISDFPELLLNMGGSLFAFYDRVKKEIISGNIKSTYFEKALLGINENLPENDPGLIFHHGKRNNIWYGSPMMYKLV